MISCNVHGRIDSKTAVGCPECVVLLRAIGEAACEEVVFTYSHPLAAERGQVWTEYTKTPKFYKAMKAYWEALEIAGQKAEKKARKKKS